MLKLPPIYFQIIWPILYLFLIITYILFVLRPPSNQKLFKYANIFFWMNIFFNFLYLLLFFGLDSYYGGLIDLILLVITGWVTSSRCSFELQMAFNTDISDGVE